MTREEWLLVLCRASQNIVKEIIDCSNHHIPVPQEKLIAQEIINQIVSLPEFNTLTNLVFMGMGEPLDNLENLLTAIEILTADYGFAMSPRRITVSTVGIIKHLPEFIEKTEVHLAVSLHNPFAQERAEIMPIENTNPLSKV